MTAVATNERGMIVDELKQNMVILETFVTTGLGIARFYSDENIPLISPHGGTIKETRAFPLTSLKQQGNTMPKERQPNNTSKLRKLTGLQRRSTAAAIM